MNSLDPTPVEDAEHLAQLNRRAWILLSDRESPDIDGVRELIAQGADLVRGPGLFRRNLLHELAAIGHPDAIAFALELGGDVNQRSSSGETPLHKLLARLPENRSKRIGECARLLIAHGADVSATWGANSETPLRTVCISSGMHFEVVMALLDAGAYLDTVSAMICDDWEGRLELNYHWWEPYRDRWEQAREWLAAPDVAQLTPQLVCALSNIGRLDAVCDAALWQGHEAALMGLLTQVPPWLANRMAASPLAVLLVPEAPRPQIESPVETIDRLQRARAR